MFRPAALPDPLTCADGTGVADVATWRNRRRPELLERFAREVYGRAPARRVTLRVEPLGEADALDRAARRRDLRVRFGDGPSGPALHLTMVLPRARGPFPAFLGLNFAGNAAVLGGREASRWPVATIVERGYAFATACYEDIEPDRIEGWRDGIRALFPEVDPASVADGWGAIGAWAWGLSRALDCLEGIADIDARRVAVVGHSRLGKAALWAAAQDERFALAIANASGRGGAAVARRRAGESIAEINAAFPHWFCGNFKRYADREDELPVDQHELVASIAPRPVLVCSGADDAWADPPGEFLGVLAADPVYRLHGVDGLAATSMPPTGTPILSTLGYHVREGGHDMTAVDWTVFLAFADAHLSTRSTQ